MPVAIQISTEKHIRFNFLSDLCFGCPSCVTACREKNALPQGVDRRRLGELENPAEAQDVPAIFLSMACNHCLEPACEKGCPVGAYSITKEGIVLHDPKICMGCGYCTDTCPYGVPLLRPDTGVVTKCDFCIDLLEKGEQPACAEACPSGAIKIEKRKIEVILEKAETDGAGPELPPPNLTIPSTKFTAPRNVPWNILKRVFRRATKTEPPEMSLNLFTLLFHMAGVAGIIALFSDFAMGQIIPYEFWITIAGTGTLAFLTGSFHPGRPDRGYRFFRRVATSPMSLELFAAILFIGSAIALGGSGDRLVKSSAALSFSLATLTGLRTVLKIHTTYTRPVRTYMAYHFPAAAMTTGFVFWIALASINDIPLSTIETAVATALVILNHLYGKRTLAALPSRPEKELQTAALLRKEVLMEEQIQAVFLAFAVTSLLSILSFQTLTPSLAIAAAIATTSHAFMARRIYYRLSVPRTVPGARKPPEKKNQLKNILKRYVDFTSNLRTSLPASDK